VHLLKRWSSVIGLVAAGCAVPVVLNAIDSYRMRGAPHPSDLYRMLAVPLIYIIALYAERQIRS
jgi:hypothetical protein